MKVGLVQLCSGITVSENIAETSRLIRAAAADGAALVATPEMTHLVQKHKEDLLSKISPQDKEPAVRAFADLAKELEIDLLIGSMALKEGEKIANRAFHFTPDGVIKACYDKIHLFDAQVSDTESYRESSTYTAGEGPVMTAVGQTKIGLSICYDLRFPALYRYYAQEGAEIVTIPAAFTVPTGRAHWDILLRARAIESGSYVLAAAQGGAHEDGRRTWGRSKVIDPWGEIVAELDHDRPGHVVAEIDLSQVSKARKRIPAWADTRPF
ncbi:carbon-nitrogen hydrolase family protein [Litorimonas haliclonae]|uniref:carbon-nitrogen hydrolase family protein n=1 Tax=Litorimonas haliclonae TaxID=2081977 RepID=UPI0039EF520E